jgi:hypothetical protein
MSTPTATVGFGGGGRGGDVAVRDADLVQRADVRRDNRPGGIESDLPAKGCPVDAVRALRRNRATGRCAHRGLDPRRSRPPTESPKCRFCDIGHFGCWRKEASRSNAREPLGTDEEEAPGGAIRAGPAAAFVKSSSDALTARIHGGCCTNHSGIRCAMTKSNGSISPEVKRVARTPQLPRGGRIRRRATSPATHHWRFSKDPTFVQQPPCDRAPRRPYARRPGALLLSRW